MHPLEVAGLAADELAPPHRQALHRQPVALPVEAQGVLVAARFLAGDLLALHGTLYGLYPPPEVTGLLEAKLIAGPLHPGLQLPYKFVRAPLQVEDDLADQLAVLLAGRIALNTRGHA